MIDNSLFDFLLIAVLILCSGFFSGSETALTVASLAKIHKLKKNLNKKAVAVFKIMDAKEDLISTILFSNNIINIFASSLATSFAIRHFGDIGIVYSTLVMTAIIFIFAELIPKSYAIRHADSMALRISPIVLCIMKIMTPINLINRGLNRIFIDKKSKAEYDSINFIRGVIDIEHDNGNIQKSNRNMLKNILDLNDITVDQIMTHRMQIASINLESSYSELKNEIINLGYSRIPVWENSSDNIMGVIYYKDVFSDGLSNTQNDTDNVNNQDKKTYDHWHELITKADFITQNTRVIHQLNNFIAQKTHIAFVVNEFGELLGLITLEDILEEIVGNIYDEYDKELKSILKLENNQYKLLGTLPIRDINRELHLELDDDSSLTISGFIINHLKKFPKKGETVEIDNLSFEIKKISKNVITEVILEINNISKEIEE